MKTRKEKRKIIILFLAIAAVFLTSQNADAAINSQINYQGKLTDDDNVAVADGNYNMIISIYDADSGGNCLWTARGTCGSPSSRAVAVVNGIFSIMLGDAVDGDNALTGLDFNSAYYLGVKVGSDSEMTPRKPIGASGYAFNSSLLNGLASATSGATAHILATDSSGNATISGSTYFNGTTYYVNSSGTGNLNGLTLAGDLAVNGNDITSTGALTVTPAAGSNFNIALSGVGDFAVNTNQFYVDTATGNIGIGNASPSFALHLGTTASSNLGTTANSLMVSGGLEVAGSAYLGPMQFPTNSGAISWIDMPVSAAATPNAAESYTARIGGTDILTVYGQALGSGAGGIINSAVGIGTVTPAHKLQITDTNTTANRAGLYVAQSGVIAGTGYGSYVAKTGASTTNVGGYFSASGATNNYGLVVANGNAGFGTTSPTTKLAITTSTNIDGIYQTDGTRWMRYMSGTVGVSAFNALVQANDNAIIYSNGTQGAGNLVIAPWSSSAVGLRMDGSGNVGIATASPSYTLHVTGTGGFSTSANSPIFQGMSAGTTFGNASYMTTIAGSGVTISPAAWTATPTISGLITATSGLTANGALTANNTFTLGDNGDAGSINTSDWDISTTGVMAGISGITNDGVYTQSGTSANTFTGTSTFSNATYSALFTGGNVGIGMSSPTALLHLTGTAGKVSLEINSNETTAASNVLMLRSDLASGDDAIFRVQADGAVYADGAYTGTGADYAEYFYTENVDLKSGEVVCVDIERSNSVKRCARSGDNNVMGVVSTNPAVIGNGSGQNRNNDPNYKIIGMVGQVPGFVTGENGSIKIGDNLTSASIQGYLRKADAGESTVGVAMEDFSGESGKIQILISRRNQSLTVEKVEQAVLENIANMNIQDKVNAIVNSARSDLDVQMENFATSNQLQISSFGTDISSMKAMQMKIQDDMDLIAQQNKTVSDFIVNLNVEDIIYKDAMGNINLLSGKILAKDIEATDSVEANDLKGENLVLGSEVSGTGEIEAGKLESEPIKTKEAIKEMKIYITPKDSTEGKVLYYEEKDIKDRESFTVRINSSLEKDVEFNWLIIK